MGGAMATQQKIITGSRRKNIRAAQAESVLGLLVHFFIVLCELVPVHTDPVIFVSAFFFRIRKVWTRIFLNPKKKKKTIRKRTVDASLKTQGQMVRT